MSDKTCPHCNGTGIEINYLDMNTWRRPMKNETCGTCEYRPQSKCRNKYSRFHGSPMVDTEYCDHHTPKQPTAGHEPGWKWEMNKATGDYDRLLDRRGREIISFSILGGRNITKSDADLIASAPTLAAENKKLRDLIKGAANFMDETCFWIDAKKIAAMRDKLESALTAQGDDDG